jgi:hypothetical protein
MDEAQQFALFLGQHRVSLAAAPAGTPNQWDREDAVQLEIGD